MTETTEREGRCRCLGYGGRGYKKTKGEAQTVTTCWYCNGGRGRSAGTEGESKASEDEGIGDAAPELQSRAAIHSESSRSSGGRRWVECWRAAGAVEEEEEEDAGPRAVFG